MTDYVATLNFNHDQLVGKVFLDGNLPDDLHNYVLTPAYAKKSDGKLHVIEYALVHHNNLPSVQLWEERNQQALTSEPMPDPEDL